MIRSSCGTGVPVMALLPLSKNCNLLVVLSESDLNFHLLLLDQSSVSQCLGSLNRLWLQVIHGSEFGVW